jgi:uncharacterized protein YqeY
MLLNKIENDFREALTKRDELKISVLRMLKTAIRNKEVDLRVEKKELTDEIIIDVIKKELKRRKEAIEAFEKGNRLDLAEKEKKEMEILLQYLPEELSDEKIKEIVKNKITELKTTGLKDFGKVMGFVMKEVKAQADGERVAKIVKEELGKFEK